MTGTRQKILLVDDEQHQLDTVCRGLFLYGYECDGALSAHQALQKLRQDMSSYSMLITDLTMPDQSGIGLIEKVRDSWPSLPIIVITGLQLSQKREAFAKMGIPLLQKPFQPDQLASLISQYI